MPNQAGTIERIALELSRALESMSGLIKPDIVTEFGSVCLIRSSKIPRLFRLSTSLLLT